MQIGVDCDKAVDNRRVYVVDADEVTRAAVGFMLADECATHEFADLDSAFAHAQDFAPDLVILGRAIVETGGHGVFAQVAARGARAVVLAESGARDYANACLAAGARGVIYKPLDIATVRAKVDAFLGRLARTTFSLQPI